MKKLGVGLVVLAAIFWGLSGGLAGILMEKGWNPLVITFYRGAVGFICVVIWMIARTKYYSYGSLRKMIFWSLLAGLGVTGNFSFYFTSISHSGVAIASVLMYTAPIFVFIISFILKMERVTLFKIIAMLIVLGGMGLLTGVIPNGIGQLNLLGITAGLLSGLSYAIFIFAFNYALKYGEPPAILSTALFAFSLILFPFIDHEQAISVFYSEDIFWFIVLGLIGAGLSFFFYVKGLRATLPSVASVVAMAEPVTASLFGGLFLGQFLTLTQIIGMAVILITITILSTRKSA
ncbi:DMT family transporter [Pontibacillus sp. HMF3514]|uniref:DMT family transporter n=1 Tax=Pontibacillus sp. HMF3514 TaxID=2692425 RepID=UPI00131F648E|nr:EamA family transporter [Pontibacillus sp. HMF3514]QHE51671.1 EamA family transporter [Pontibacillus sp. HMF3514]